MQQTPVTTSIGSLAAAASPDRNRAIDAYRAFAMLAVSIGHWAAISVALDAEGGLDAGNALADAPQLAWITWIFQVMPLFFVVGGFASAMSLDAHARSGGRGADWVAARLRRMVAPAVVLAGTWLLLLTAGATLGFGGIVAAGAVAAAIPLWFLANYTIDTAIAPAVLPRFRRSPGRFLTGAVAVFVSVELLHTVGAMPYVGQVNWVLGWLLFQVLGFAWRDGLVPSGGRLVAIAGGLWTAAVAAVALGPWPVAMVHHEGLAHSPTAPPSVALLLFGAAYSTTAIAAAPAVNRWLARSPRAWTAVVAANGVAMSVYLWHFTAFVAVAAVAYGFAMLPTATVATAAWWVQKLPLMLAATVVLAAIVAVVNGVERRALLAPREPWRGGETSMLATAAVVSAAVKLWGLGSAPAVAAGTGLLVVVWFAALRPRVDIHRKPASAEADAVSAG